MSLNALSFMNLLNLQHVVPFSVRHRRRTIPVGRRFFAMACAYFLTFSIACAAAKTERWGVHEITLPGPSEGNPYLEVSLEAEFRQGAVAIKVPGFYDGNGIYRIRFSPGELGAWTFVTKSNVQTMDGLAGAFDCVVPVRHPALRDNHGPVRVVNDFYFEYADGTPYYCVGTTAYGWTSVKQTIQEQTLATLSGSPFNKIRMCVFPKHFRLGSDIEPWQHPFQSSIDFTRPNFAFFQNFDRRVRQLLELGIQADVILFHPYDKWGYSNMGDETNARYVRYLIARLSAYRNVWWSVCNEWSLPRIKDNIDWEQIGTILQNEDPHNRLRGIHNWVAFYDHTRPWITHVSMQTASFTKTTEWRALYQKPVLFDEMRYEGDVPAPWGNLNAEDMTSYFWMAGLSGAYGTHGDTARNQADHETEVRWWAKGGLLTGRSPLRIAFFRFFMESLPVKEMTPRLISENVAKDSGGNIFTFFKEGDVYVAYTRKENTEISLQLSGNHAYDLYTIDTWEMEKRHVGKVPAGSFTYKTTNRDQAVYLRAIR